MWRKYLHSALHFQDLSKTYAQIQHLYTQSITMVNPFTCADEIMCMHTQIWWSVLETCPLSLLMILGVGLGSGEGNS